MNDYNETNTELEDLINEAYVYSYPLQYNLWMIEQFVDGKFPHQKKSWNEFSHSIDKNIRENLIQFSKKNDQVIRKLKPTVKEKITNGWNSLVHAADNNTYFEKGTIDSPEWFIEDRQQAYIQRVVAAFETLWKTELLNGSYKLHGFIKKRKVIEQI